MKGFIHSKIEQCDYGITVFPVLIITLIFLLSTGEFDHIYNNYCICHIKIYTSSLISTGMFLPFDSLLSGKHLREGLHFVVYGGLIFKTKTQLIFLVSWHLTKGSQLAF